MKKLIVSILTMSIVLALFQPTILCVSNKNTLSEEEKIEQQKIIDEGNAKLKNILERGVADITIGADGSDSQYTTKRKVSFSTTGSALGAHIVCILGSAIAGTISFCLSSIAKEPFTIHDAVFNDIEVFDANYLLNNDDGNDNNNKYYSSIKKSVAEWYYSIRNIAIIISLVVLIYVGIRMAISTVAEEEAKYKKMLIGWVQSFILIFILHYIILISMALSKGLLDVITAIKPKNAVEAKIYQDSLIGIYNNPGWDCVPYALTYWVMVFYQVKFFMLYAKRTLSIAFLIVIAPLITVTYPIDKLNDGKAQAFKAWIQEFEVNMFIQPLHALLYLVFIVSASEIATRAPLFAAIFFMALSRGEKVVKEIFNARGMKSIHSMGKGKKKKKR